MEINRRSFPKTVGDASFMIFFVTKLCLQGKEIKMVWPDRYIAFWLITKKGLHFE